MYPPVNNVYPYPRGFVKKTLALFYIIDCSGSMEGSRISMVNRSLQEALSFHLPDLQKNHENDMNLQIGILIFHNICSWVTGQGLVPYSGIKWEDLKAVKGSFSSMGAAFYELNNKLQIWLPPVDCCYRPSFILISDGAPTDNWEAGLFPLKNNMAFRYGTKAAIAIEDDADMEVLAQFTGDKKNVFKAKNDEDTLYRLIEKCTFPSSEPNSATNSFPNSVIDNPYTFPDEKNDINGWVT